MYLCMSVRTQLSITSLFFDIFFFYSDGLALRIDYVCSSKIFTLLMLKLRLFWQDKKNCKPKRIESILIHFLLAKSQKNYFFFHSLDLPF